MKRNLYTLNAVVLMLCLISLMFLSGCETAKGMGRDIKTADQWLRDHAW